MHSILIKYTDSQISKAKHIKALMFDVDGVLTDGSIIYTNKGDELKSFNVKDGQIIRHLKNHGILVGAITGRSSELVERRCQELKLDFVHQGVKDKGSLIKKITENYKISFDEVAYIGDDIIDLPVLTQVGLSASPIDALGYVKEHAHIVTELPGGQGVVREVADLILASKGLLTGIVNEYIS